MKVVVNFFYEFQKITGRKEIEIEIKKNSTIQELIKLLETIYPGIKNLTEYHEDYSMLLNGIHVNPTKRLEDRDVIDLFTIIDGG